MESNAVLGDYISTQKGFAFKSKWFVDSGRKIVKVSDFTEDSICPNNLVKIPVELGEQYSRYSLAFGDVVIQSVGSWPSNPASVVGKTIRVPRTVDGSLLNQNAVKIIPNKDIHIGFLYYLLRSDVFKEYIIGTAQGAASQASITLDAIKRFKFALPNFVVQESIASKLENYDNLIENNNRRIAILEDMAQSLYREWFVNFRYPGHKENLDADGNAKLIDSPLGQIPDGWEVKAAADAITINPRTKLSKDGEKPFVGMSGLSESSMVISDIIKKTGNSGAKFINGDTLFARITPCLQNGKTGYVQFLESEQPVGFGSTEFIVLRQSEDLSSEFIYLLSRSNNFREHAIKSMTGATGRQRVHPDSFASYLLAVPPKEVMEEFTGLVKPMFKSIFNLSKRNENLKQQRDMLLPKLISGQIELKE
ncbi:restriction endonuclease subunit S [Pseudoalteromonas sp. S4741]|uniref:restriction endonuclease subunit S n=1 Tax=Pseudoalteromonas sp. S4741 TaxID=579563 RepID=UPI00110BF443|nr:restriction endonuclease subunit S [Pseudoalteromonas sp. S4741]TMO26921.1 restriction endonuclease subunit S [Pseudoalteromonas sp. S4741]